MTTMQQFVRKSIIQCTATFTPLSGGSQPSTAFCTLAYQTLTGANATATVALSYNSGPGTWTGTWDSTPAGQCIVNWVAYGSGGVQGSTQGQFQILANAANTI